MKKHIIKYFGVGLGALIFMVSCEVNDFDLQDDPNFLTPESAAIVPLMNELQYLFQNFMEDMAVNSANIMRYESMTQSYLDEVTGLTLDGEWERHYEAINISIAIENQTESDPAFLFHNAINKLLMGYLTITLVDHVGDIPYLESAKPSEFPNPNLDNAEEIYTKVLADIDQAIADIEASEFPVNNDLFYDGDKGKWIAFANSFKLRLLIQTRLASNEIGVSDLTAEINNLLSNDIIDTEEEDFVYRHAAVEEPESRHLFFRRGYVSTASTYMSNDFMFKLKDSKSNRDPRIRYYLYRQSDINPFSGPPYLACLGDPNADYCYLGEQYWGLDHGETRTGRGDNAFRTTYGIYPGGGAFDEDQFLQASETSNLGGAGFIPVLTSSYMKFLLAESALVLDTNGDSRTLLEEAIRASIDKVMNFGGVTSPLAPTSSDVDNYVDEVMTSYDNTGTDEERLNIIITEFYIAGFGNSIEAYNAYRRTGYPSDLQIPIENDNPTFPRSYLYSRDAIQLNSSFSQKQVTDKIFWDTNPDGFIK
jgi:hypothetical protein